jgi:hypothetical protein
MFELDDITNFDFSEWLMTSVFSIHNPFAVYFWLVVAVIIIRFTFIIIPLGELLGLLGGSKRSFLKAFRALRELNSSAFKPLEHYVIFETTRMIIPVLVATLLRLILGGSSNYEWNFIQLLIVLPSVVLWTLYNINDIISSKETIEKATKYLTPRFALPLPIYERKKGFSLWKTHIWKPKEKGEFIINNIVKTRQSLEAMKDLEEGEKSEPYEMNIEKMRMSSNYDSGDGIEIESKFIDNEAVIHNTKELAKKAHIFAGNLLVDGKRAVIAAADKKAKSFDDNLSMQIEEWFEIKSKKQIEFISNLLNSLGPLIIIYAILPFTI